ncbi:MAG: hypothetical protein QNK23_08395 [Crocinitomicaceae bacterium]|nr:hypothetical protein [Crocinitomicaceae bacterium]
MKTIILTCTICTLLVSNTLFSQLEWGVSFGDVFYERSKEILIDNSGNSYMIGEFSGNVDLDPGVGSDVHSTLNSYGGYISKLDPSGNFIWAKSFTSASGVCSVNSFCIDNLGNIYLTGFFSGIVDFDPGSSIVSLNGGIGNGLFILKLDSSGNFIWAKQSSTVANSGNVIGHSIDHDTFGNIVVGGSFSSSQAVDFDPGPGIENLISTGSSLQDIFILKLDSNGDFIWVNKFGGVGDDRYLEIAIDNADNIAATGIFYDTVDFDPSGLIYNLIAPSNDRNVVVLKLDSNGNFVWAGSIGNFAGDYIDPSDIAFDNSNEIVVSGSYAGSIDFDTGASTVIMSSNGATDGFVLKLDAAGNYLWSNTIGGNDQDEVNSIDFDNTNNIYLAGVFMSTVDFDSGTSTSNLTATGVFDGFVLKTNSSGIYMNAFSLGGTGITNPSQIKLDNSGNIFLCGSFSETCDLDPSVGTVSYTSNGDFDSFACKLQSVVSINELELSQKKLVKIVDYLGRECEPVYNQPLIYIFEDGSTQRVYKVNF